MTNPVRIRRPPRGVQSVKHALSILPHLGSAHEPPGLTELSTRLGLGKSTVQMRSWLRCRQIGSEPSLRHRSRPILATPSSIPGGSAAELDEARARGVALSCGERDEFTVGVAAPVRGYPGVVITVMTVAGMIGRLDVEASTLAVRAAAGQLSTALSARIGPDA